MPYRRGPASGDAGYNKFNFISTSTQNNRKNRRHHKLHITHAKQMRKISPSRPFTFASEALKAICVGFERIRWAHRHN